MKEINGFLKDLEVLREEIDKVDDDIIELLNKRARISQKIGNIKKLVNMDTFQPEREKEIIKRMKSKSIVLKRKSIIAIWKDIIDACKLIQEI